jgi:hypothetical protein
MRIPLAIALLSLLSFVAPARAQSTLTLAQRANTPAQAEAILKRDLQLPGSTVFTLIAKVYLWPKENVSLVCKKSAVKIPKKYVMMLAEKFGQLDSDQKRFTEEFSLSDILEWASQWDEPDAEVCRAWLKHKPVFDVDTDKFKREWLKKGGKALPDDLLTPPSKEVRTP